jgi:FAD binding domain/Berberine and berberine like
MDEINSASWTARVAGKALRSIMQGKVVLPDDDDYAGARTVWNAAVDHRPAVIAQCETAGDVQLAITAARTYGLPVSVRGGGHDWAGRAIRDNGLVIDLSAMRLVTVEPDSGIAIVSGGALAKDVIAAAEPYGLVAVTGACGTVGMTGLTLGGGYGALNGRYGLAADNLLGAQVVLADGRCVIADTLENPELFWALRGGGGNFGVVTSMRIRLHPLRSVLGGLILFPWHDAELVLRAFAEFVASAPDDLTVMAGALTAPDGRPVLFVAPTWCGEAKEGETLMAALQNLGDPIMSGIGPMTYRELLGMFDAYIPPGRHHAIKTRWLPRLTANAISALSIAGQTMTSPFSAIVVRHVHGAAARVGADETAFGCRCEHFVVEALASWEPRSQENGASHWLWAQNLSAKLARDALPGGYANLLGPNDYDQIEWAYGDNLNRLQRVKDRYDPGNMFSATPMPARIKEADDQPAMFSRA